MLKNDFIAIDVSAISDVYPNRNNSYFPVSAMQNAKPTFYNKPALGAFDVTHDDFKAHEMEYRWECSEYERKTYGRAYSTEGLNYKKEILKEKLWNIPMWRGVIKIVHKIKKC